MLGHSPDRFEVLIVCTANHCRSPMAEAMLQAATRSIGFNWTVRSAGTHADSGVPMHPYAALELSQRTMITPGWLSSALTAQSIAQADLVLTAEAVHRKRVVELLPSAVNRTFPILQFAALAENADPIVWDTGAEAGQALLDAARGARSRVAQTTPDQYDLADPIGRRHKAFHSCAEVLLDAVNRIVFPLRPAEDLVG